VHTETHAWVRLFVDDNRHRNHGIEEGYYADKEDAYAMRLMLQPEKAKYVSLWQCCHLHELLLTRARRENKVKNEQPAPAPAPAAPSKKAAAKKKLPEHQPPAAAPADDATPPATTTTEAAAPSTANTAAVAGAAPTTAAAETPAGAPTLTKNQRRKALRKAKQ